MVDRESIARARADIAEYGFHVVKVFTPHGVGPDYAYSVGFREKYAHPEVVVTGVDLHLGFEIIGCVARELAAGKRFVAGARSAEILEGFSVAFIDVDAKFAEELAVAVAVDGDRFAALQCVWPDKDGHFPWDAGVDKRARDAQLLFGRPAPSG